MRYQNGSGKALVSVIIPNFNGQHHLEYCLPSLFESNDEDEAEGEVEEPKVKVSKKKKDAPAPDVDLASLLDEFDD